MIFDVHKDKSKRGIPDRVRAKVDSVVFGRLHKGEMFGEHSAINGTANLFSVEVDSKEAKIYEINSKALKMLRHTAMLNKLRSVVIIKTNWVAFKTQRLQELSEVELESMRHRE